MAAYEEPIATRGGKITLETCVNYQPTYTFGAYAFAKPTIQTGTTFGSNPTTTTGTSFGTGFGAANNTFSRPTMSSFAYGGFNAGTSTFGATNAYLEPPSLMDDLLNKLQRYVYAEPDSFAHVVDPSNVAVSFRPVFGQTRFTCSCAISPPLDRLEQSKEVVLRFSNEHGSAELLEPLLVENLPDNLDEICKIEPGSITINAPVRALCCLKNVEADGATDADRNAYIQNLSRQCGVEFVQYFYEDGVWVFRK